MVFPITSQATLETVINEFCEECAEKSTSQTATVILDKGNTALLSRVWLTRQATQSIDVQYFIWSHDNIGILAAAELLAAADRGVKVRVIVDDFLVDTDMTQLIALEKHPNIDIKIYNALHKVGVSTPKRIWNLLTNFRNANQRMHDKLAVFDNQIAITGGRNMADEYFDFNKEYSFRDRDVLVLGQAVGSMTSSFERFWQHDLSQSLSDLLPKETAALSEQDRQLAYQNLRDYSSNEANFLPSVSKAIEQLDQRFPQVANEKRWSQAEFVADMPGKNSGKEGLGGGGISTEKLHTLVKQAQQEIVIQSPYVVVPDELLDTFKQLIENGVSIKISTNSLASTDNLMAFSGYHKVREELLDIGVELFEYKPNPKNFEVLYQNSSYTKDEPPTFAIHAKSMVIDQQTAIIGTFNFDPRSINLNTEVALIIPETNTAMLLRELILDDMATENSWELTKQSNPDDEVSFGKKMKLRFFKLLPLKEIL